MMNGMHTRRYLEWVLAELPKARPSTPEGYARFLPCSDEVPESYLIVPGEEVGDPTALMVDPDDARHVGDVTDPLAL